MQRHYPIKITAEEYKTIAELLNKDYVTGVSYSQEGFAAMADRKTHQHFIERTLIDGKWVYEQVNDIPQEYMTEPVPKQQIVLDNFEQVMSFFKALNEYNKGCESED